MTGLILPDGVAPTRERDYSESEMVTAYQAGMTNASGVGTPAQWLIDFFRGGDESTSGVTINYETSLGYAYVFSAVSLISGDVACLPLNVYDVDEQGDRTVAVRDPAQWLLNEEPNELMSALTLREILQSHALLWGNGYAAIERDMAMRPLRLVPLLPDRTKACLSDDGALYYETYETYESFRRMSDPIQLLPDQVFHLKGIGFDGLSGHSVFQLAGNSWGLALAQERHGSKHFKHGARPSITLETESRLDKPTADMLLQRWEERHGGENNDALPALLSHGLKVNPFSMSNEDSQWLEGRKFQRVEVAAWFRMPPHKLGDDSRLSYNSIEAENRAYLNQCLHQWLTKWEDESRRKLLTERARRARTRTIKHDTQDLLTADIETQVDVLTKLRAQQIVSGNEVRRKLGFPRAEGLDGFENPNTSTGAPPPSDPDPDPAPEPDDQVSARVLDGQRQLLATTIGRMIDIERKSVVKAASKPGFAAWLEKHYADNGLFAGKVSGAMEPVLKALAAITGSTAGPGFVAARHVTASREMLLEIAGNCAGPDQLLSHVTEAVADWPARADAMADFILEQALCTT